MVSFYHEVNSLKTRVWVKGYLVLIERTYNANRDNVYITVPPGLQGISRRFFLRDFQYYTVPAA